MVTPPPPATRIYLDYAAATPLLPAVFAAMEPYLREQYGNPGAIHAEGETAKMAVKKARQDVAHVLGVQPGEIIFTGSGTESNNLAVLGHLDALHDTGRSYERMEVLTTEIEHPSLLALLPLLTKKGVRVRYVPVTETGVITRDALLSVLSPDTVLFACAYANSEIGTVQPVSRLVRTVRAYERETAQSIWIHLDAAQAPLWLPCARPRLGVDSLALDAGKCGGPKGVGILCVKDKTQLSPILYGGGQEGGLRPGTENVAGIVGAATALTVAQAEYEARAEEVSAVRDAALARLGDILPDAILNGSLGEERLANNINFSLPGFDTEYAVVWLNERGVAASTKSACAGAGSGRSQVVYVCTADDARARATIRLTMGAETALADLEFTFSTLASFCAKMRELTN